MKNARNSAITAAYSAKETDLDQVEWLRPGYLIFFIDVPGWDFLYDDDKIKSLYFAKNDELGDEKRHANCSFFDAFPDSLVVDSKLHPLLVVKNHHFKAPENGNPTYRRREDGENPDYYKFDLYVGMPIENGNGKKLWFVIDPGGKNLGP